MSFQWANCNWWTRFVSICSCYRTKSNVTN